MKQGEKWYEIPAGKALAIIGIFLALSAVTVSIDSLRAIDEAGILFDVYLFAFFGAMARSLLSLVTDVNPDTDDVAFIQRSWFYIVRLGLRLIGALCLAAGLFLAQNAVDNALVFSFAPPARIVTGTAFLAGFYVEQAYYVLGTFAKRILSLTERDDGESSAPSDTDSSVAFTPVREIQRPDENRWFRDVRSLGLFGLGLVLIVIGIIASLPDNILPVVPSVTNPVPPYVYVSALLGSLGYLFTTLFKNFDRSLLSLVQKAIRIPAALLLAAGFYMFTFLFVSDGDGSIGLIAGIAFFVGLYVNVAIITLDTIASRVFSNFTDKSS